MNEAISDRFQAMPKRKSMSARSMIVRIQPVSGSGTYACGSQVSFDIPTQMRNNTFIDMSQSYLKYSMKLDASLSGAVTLDVAGGGLFYDKVQVLSQGSQITDINNYSAYRKHLVAQKVPLEWLARDGKVMLGTSGSTAGVTVSKTVKRYFCEPLSYLSPFFATESYLCGFSNDNLRLNLTWVNADRIGAWATAQTASPTNELVQFGDIELVLRVVETTSALTSQIIQAHNGIFSYPLDDVRVYNGVIPAGVDAHTQTIGASFSSLSSVAFVMDDPTGYTHLTYDKIFVKNNLSSYGLLIDGSVYPLRRTRVDIDSAEAMAENRATQHALGDVSFVGNLNEKFDADLVTGNRGNWTTLPGGGFSGSVDLSVYAKKADSIRSGLNVLASNVQLDLTFSALTPTQTNLHVFTFFDSLVSLDVRENGTGVYSVAI